MLSSHLQDLALIRGLKGRIAEMEARVGRYERRAEKRRQLATSIMEQAEIRKISKSDFTASLRRGSPALLIVDEVRIPVEFWKPQPAKLDRQKLLALLKTGQDVPGAALGEAGCSLVGENKMMCFTHTQLAALSSKLSPKDVKSRRDGNGQTLFYIEGWHAIAEANRIFGFDAWDRQTLSTECVWQGTVHQQQHACSYVARVRVTVRAGDVVVCREASGSGHGIGGTPGVGHESALK